MIQVGGCVIHGRLGGWGHCPVVEWAVAVVHGQGGLRCLAGAGVDRSWWFGIIIHGWLLSVHGVRLVVNPWRGSLSSVGSV
jgi:hypothetical protein